MSQAARIAVCTVMAFLVGAASWAVYWIIFGAVVENGVHPDYWPAKLLIAVWVLAAITGLGAALIFFRTASRRGGN